MSNLDAAWVDYKARANETPLLEAAMKCGATLKRAGGGEHVGPCPCCGGRDRFGVNVTKGKWVCRGAGGGGDAIGLVQHCMGLDFKAACEFLTGETPPSGGSGYSEAEKAEWAKRKREAEARDRRREEEEARDEEARKEVALDMWNAGRTITGSIAERYLFNRVRGLEAKGPLPDVLRFHPHCFLERGSTAPALLARVDNESGEQVGVWRIYLDKDGDNLRASDGSKIKKGLGPCGGGAIRLHPPKAGRVAVCEGVETAFGVHMLTGLPVWSCRTANGLSGFEIPFEIEGLYGFPDGDAWKWQEDKGKWLDPTGTREMVKLQKEAEAQGVAFLMQPPPKAGSDFLDLWNAMAEQMENAA